MQLRHIRPRSLEWYDAVEFDEAKGNGKGRMTAGAMPPAHELGPRPQQPLEGPGGEPAPHHQRH